MQAIQANAALFTKIHQDHTLVLANLATATQSNKNLVALLTKTISELSIQVATLTAKIATSQSKNARLNKLGHRSALAKHGHRASINPTPSNQNSIQDRNVHSRSGHKLDPNGYCSSHGYKLEESHTYTTCCFLENGYNKLATRLYIKIGKTWNTEWSNGGPTK